MAKFILILLIATAAITPFSTAMPVRSAATAPETVKVTRADDYDYSQFSTSKTYSGSATWFEDGMGACGESWDSESEKIVALNEDQMGPASASNPACGKKVQITNTANGKMVTGRILDKCPGGECSYGSLDLSPAAFRAIGDQDDGIIPIAWHYV